MNYPFKNNNKIVLSIIFFLVFTAINLSARSDIEKGGDFLKIALPASAAFISVYPYQDYQGLLEFSKALTVTVVATYSLKRIVNERRPNGNKYSFPSGHTSAAFSGASYLQRRYGWGFGAPAYLLATYVAYSRVYANKHYIHDVVAGAALAIGSTYFFVDSPFQVSPQIEEEIIGINFGYSFD